MIYTSTHKVHHLELELPIIQLSSAAWIETAPEFVDQPRLKPNVLAIASTAQHPQLGISVFYESLCKSPVRLRTSHTAEQGEKDPFRIDQCTYIAIALSILCEEWFVVGLGSFWNSNDPKNPGIGPTCSLFNGVKTQNSANVRKVDEPLLCEIYKFVYSALALHSWDSDDAKLIFFFLKCVTRGTDKHEHVLNIGLGHLFTEWHSVILHAALFFEHVLTNESGDVIGGVRVWNRIFSQNASLDETLVDIIMQHRHLVAHTNPTRALKKIKEWKSKSAVKDEKVRDTIQDFIFKSTKNCMRYIISEPQKYTNFIKQRPD